MFRILNYIMPIYLFNSITSWSIVFISSIYLSNGGNSIIKKNFRTVILQLCQSNYLEFIFHCCHRRNIFADANIWILRESQSTCFTSVLRTTVLDLPVVFLCSQRNLQNHPLIQFVRLSLWVWVRLSLITYSSTSQKKWLQIPCIINWYFYPLKET